MNTVFIKMKPVLWFLLFLVALALLSLSTIYLVSEFLHLHEQRLSCSNSRSLQDHTLQVRSLSLSYGVHPDEESFNRQILISTTASKPESAVSMTTEKRDPLVSLKAENPKLLSMTNDDSNRFVSMATQAPKPCGSEHLAEVAMRIFREKGMVLFTIINDVYLDFAASWLCNTVPMADLHQHVLFLATDLNTASKLRTLSSGINIVSLNASRFSGDQVYSHAGYIRLMVERTREILQLLECGVPLLLFEVDCVWLSNPLPLLLSVGKDRDIVATKVENRTAGGFLLLNPTVRTLTLWRQLARKMEELFDDLKNRPDSTIIFWQLNDQEYLSDLIKEQFGGIRVHHLSTDLFPDGQWYHKTAEDRMASSSPIIINNNFVSGNAAKRERAQKFGHWFLKEDSTGDVGLSCNSSAVQAVVQDKDP